MKALALFSGGLDSTLAIKLVKDQGINIVALNFVSPFCLCNQKGKCFSVDLAKQLGIPLKVMDKGKGYLKIIRKPKYGYGSGMNPCIDCRIFILKKARQYAKKIGAKFIFTGEVLDQRPMSQYRRALGIIEKEAGLEGKVLRPLSAKLLPETEAEKKGWVDRTKLLALKGRGRKEQFQLAKNLKIKDHACPGGGCLLTYEEFADKVRDLFQHKKIINMKDIELLKLGRHFRLNKNKIIVGRNEQDNSQLIKLKNKSDYVFEVPKVGSPVTLLQGAKTKKAVETAAKLTLRYSDFKGMEGIVEYGLKKPTKKIKTDKINEKETKKLRI